MKVTATSHSGHSMVPAGTTRALAISGWLTGIYFIIELGLGWWTGSVSVMSDAFHTFSAVGGVLVALVAGYYAKREPTERQSFGLIRAEIIGALFNGLFLAAMAIFILWMGFMRLEDPIELSTGWMLVAAAGGLVTEVLSFALLYKRQKENLNVQGAFWHILQTLVGSLIIIVSALVIRFTGFLAIDPLLGMGFGVVLLGASWRIIREALHILLEAVPRDLDLALVQNKISTLPGVITVHHMHAWSLTSGKNVFSAHVQVAEQEKGAALQQVIHDLLARDFQIYFSTIQIEMECRDTAEAPDIDFLKNV